MVKPNPTKKDMDILKRCQASTNVCVRQNEPMKVRTVLGFASAGENLNNSGNTSKDETKKQQTDDMELYKRGYRMGKEIGGGSYAKVKECLEIKTNRRMAAKIINKKVAPRDFLKKFMPRELQIMRTVKHENVIQTFEVVEFTEKVYVFMEVASRGDLLKYIRLRRYLKDDDARNIFVQLLCGIEYLHSQCICHRDLKCENILLSENYTVKLCDFGFGRFIGPNDMSRTFCGSAAYAAPEVLSGKPYSPFPYDIWSIGIILYIMLCGSMPFDDSNIRKMLREQMESDIRFPTRITFEARDLILSILEPDVGERFSVEDMRCHYWTLDMKAPAEELDVLPVEGMQKSQVTSSNKAEQTVLSHEKAVVNEQKLSRTEITTC